MEGVIVVSLAVFQVVIPPAIDPLICCQVPDDLCDLQTKNIGLIHTTAVYKF